ncbi:MAG: hypothetical protein HQK49_06145 [Oligoflexia bacterium]|nr:hypothetical protein [Oligoflexia bacterium]
MLKVKLKVKIIILILVLTLISIIVYLFIMPNGRMFRETKYEIPLSKREQLENKRFLQEIFVEAIKVIKNRWENGDLEGNYTKNLFNCPEEIVYKSNIDDFYLRCNPNYIQCFFSSGAGVSDPSIKIRFADKEYSVVVNPIFKEVPAYSTKKRFYKVISRSNSEGDEIPTYGIMMNISVKEFPNYSLNFILENSCDEVYLPQRLYIYRGVTKTLVWDNFERNIFVDRFLVSNRDVLEWIAYGSDQKDQSVVIPTDRALWPFPATNLSIMQMKKYCAFRGKKLMEAHIYDASSVLVLPSNQEDPFAVDEIPSIYPWTKDVNNSFIYNYKQMYMKNRGNSKMLAALDLMLKEEDCDIAYVRDCVDRFPRKLYSGSSSSWMGMSELLGGEMEYMRNVWESNNNLKLSSRFLDVLSPWHELCKRANYSQETKEISVETAGTPIYDDINEIAAIEKPYKIAFRCMRY